MTPEILESITNVKSLILIKTRPTKVSQNMYVFRVQESTTTVGLELDTKYVSMIV